MKNGTISQWQPIIGLEIHVQLNTKTKLFSSAPSRFGDEPNCNITDVCTGQPGTLPLLNKEAVRKAIQFGCAIKAEIATFSSFDRKSYFYPDSPRNYQITQFEHPIILGGCVSAEVDGVMCEFFIERAHLEDDAGTLKHCSTFAGIDYNRAGAPLIEIVSKPCIHSAKEATAYATAIKSIMIYLGASDCSMEQGSFRIDVNVSVKHKEETSLRNKIEIKNMNSFSNMEVAIEGEIARQIALYEQAKGKDPKDILKQATYRYDPELKKAVLMRTKEGAADYRHFPEPDLNPIILSKEYIEEIRATLPELPAARLSRYIEKMGLSADAAATLIADKNLSDYFDKACLHCQSYKALSNWIIVEFTGRMVEKGVVLEEKTLPPKHVAALVNMIDQGVITGKIGKKVADDMVAFPASSPEEIVKKNPDYQPLGDEKVVEELVLKVLEENPQSIIDYKAGKDRAFAFLVGQVMKLSKGKASPDLVNTLLAKHIP